VRLSEGIEWGLHCCVVLAVLPAGETLAAARLAEYHDVPPAYLAKHLQALARAGVVESVPGPRGGYRLTRPAADISVLEVVDAIEGSTESFVCTEIRQRGPVAPPINSGAFRAPCGIARAMRRAEDAYRRELAAQSLAELVVDVGRAVTAETAQRFAAWYGDIRRPVRA
jgi:Rrf2 family protein